LAGVLNLTHLVLFFFQEILPDPANQTAKFFERNLAQNGMTTQRRNHNPSDPGWWASQTFID